MLTAKEAKIKILANPTFERKVELFNQVTKIIEKAVEAREKSFQVTEEQHFAVGAELRQKGYSQNVMMSGISFGGFTVVPAQIVIGSNESTLYTHTYYMN